MTTTTDTAIDAAIEQAQALISGDGTRLEVLDRSTEKVHFKLDLSETSCADCVLPVTHLVTVIGNAMRTASGNPELDVLIDDPRVTA